MAETHKDRMNRAVGYKDRINAGFKAAREFVRVDELSAEDLEALKVMYEKYQVKKAYKKDDIFLYNGNLYKVLQDHTSQADWIPSSTASLYLKVEPAGVIPEWKQPTGSHDAYKKGDKVIFGGKVYESLIDANTWSPTGYPQGWKLME